VRVVGVGSTVDPAALVEATEGVPSGSSWESRPVDEVALWHPASAVFKHLKDESF
jgi:hypothetical protein